MTRADVAIRAAGPEQHEQLAELLADAFLDGDFAEWLVPDPSERARIYPPYFSLLLEPALKGGLIEVIGDGAAAAVWYPESRNAPPEPEHYENRLAKICGAHTDRFLALDDALIHNHPTTLAADYCAFVAVHPSQQGQGLGTALLRHHHQDADQAGRICYLEATGTRNKKLYARHGYAPRRTFSLGSDGPTAYPMHRMPSP